jgi:hypothetical protein
MSGGGDQRRQENFHGRKILKLCRRSKKAKIWLFRLGQIRDGIFYGQAGDVME